MGRISAIACTRLADSGKGASAVAVLIGGMTVANLVGVPGFTYVCHALSWRLPFGIVAITGIITFFSVRIWMPRIEALPDSGLKGQFRFLSLPAPWLIYSGIFFGQMSVYMWLSYISPIMTSVTGLPESSMTYIMVVVGAGMVFGNIVSGKMADRYAPAKVSMVIAALIVVVMPLIWLLSPYRLPSLILAFIAPGLLFGLGGPPQFLIVGYSRGGEMLGGAGIQIAFNVSNAVAAAIGGATDSVMPHRQSQGFPVLSSLSSPF